MWRLLPVPALAVIGGFLVYIGALGQGFGFPSISPGAAILTTAGVISMMGASFYAVGLYQRGPPGPKDPAAYYGAVVLGFILILAGQFLSYPVGCNLAGSCPASPEGTWSTIWPNVTLTFIGIVLGTWGFGKARSSASELPGLGLGMAVGGFLLLVSGQSMGYMTMCPSGGCPPLTAGQWWSLFWPDVVAEALGATCIIVGLFITALGWSRRSPLDPYLSRHPSA